MLFASAVGEWNSTWVSRPRGLLPSVTREIANQLFVADTPKRRWARSHTRVSQRVSETKGTCALEARLLLMPLKEDRDAIIEVLRFTQKLFDLLIPRLSPFDQQLFQDAWNETRPILEQQISLIQSITAEEHPLWSALRRVGLTGKNLAMKLHYLAKAASGGWRKKLLDLLNRFLGSLASGLPGVEPIKELKEWLEDQLDDQLRADPGPDPSIVSCYSNESYKYFH